MIDQSPLPEYDLNGGRLMITSPYGQRWGRLHAGVDLGTTNGIEIGVPTYPVNPGIIYAIKNDGPAPSAGINIHLLCDDGSRWKYFHLNDVTVHVNQRVDLNTVIAHVGNTGTGAAHLHLEKHVGSFSNPVDPGPEVSEAMAAGRYPGASTPPPPPPEDDMGWNDWTPQDRTQMLNEFRDFLVGSDEFKNVIANGALYGVSGQAKANGKPYAADATNLGDIANLILATRAGNVDIDDLAQALTVTLGPAVVKELAKALAS